jgi:holo-[acyl-carrier protein] synthase|tara:strand:+ start:1296 stop:1682 length:387 start_codon:yes stop_codon:yes gene_type:complete
MKIVGIGVDLVKNKRIKSSITKSIFINRTFGKDEILRSKKIFDKTIFFSKRFAAKEALAKAIGTGFRKGLNFKDIQIANNSQGKPYYKLTLKLKNFIKKKKKINKFNLFLSISDEKEYSVAFAVIQST